MLLTNVDRKGKQKDVGVKQHIFLERRAKRWEPSPLGAINRLSDKRIGMGFARFHISVTLNHLLAIVQSQLPDAPVVVKR